MKTLFLIFFLFITHTSYSKEVDLICRGTLTLTSNSFSDKEKIDLNFSFEDTKETITTQGRLLCTKTKTKENIRQFTKQSISISSETEDKKPTDSDYCFHSFDLNRNSGLLKTTKMENSEGLIVIYTGNFNCELAKQKF